MSLLPDDIVAVSGYDLVYPSLGARVVEWVETLPRGTMTVLDPGPLAADIPAQLLARTVARAAIYTMNRREAALLLRSVNQSCEALIHALRESMRISTDTVVIVRTELTGA